MSKTIKLRKGYDIRLSGEAPRFEQTNYQSRLFAIKPPDYNGLTPRLIVEQGSEVKAGSVLFQDKTDETIQFTSPVSGEIVDIVRGERRVILEILILADSKNEFIDFGKANPNDLSSEEIKSKLLASGCWTLMRQRPFNKVPQTQLTPKNIFISGFDSAPFATNIEYAVSNELANMQTAIDALRKLTDGKVYLGLSTAQKQHSVFTKLNGVEITYFEGPHPAGNVGVQIHHTAPINKDEVVWTISPQDLVTIGRLFNQGIYDTQRLFSISGDVVRKKGYFRSYLGAQVTKAIENNLLNEHVRIISGNPLTGTKVSRDGFIGTFQNSISVIEEGDEPEFFGWLCPTYKRPSLSRTFTSFMHPQEEYQVNTNMHGEARAFVMSGEYDKVLPMDVLPLQFFKACYTFDLNNMEGLGIYEVVEEDIALCEFICTSKMPLQQILREAINYLEKES
ncbi:MAG: Na(+)-translocating NADH-quinone reductase subunit A [Bacteroidetes bacterium]|nr:Na(+)-translocating NADH-quinone reductase subunit A [Bacteroidota bacterium]